MPEEKTKSKYHYCRATATVNGKRYEGRGKTQREAEKSLAQKIADAKRYAGRDTVRTWASVWLETYERPRIREPGSRKRRGTMADVAYQQRKGLIENYVLPYIGSVKLCDVTPTMLQGVLNRDACQSYSHVQKLRVAIQLMFRQAWLDKKTEFDPAANLVMPATEKGTRRGMTAEEKEVFFKAAKINGHGLMFRFLLATGIRPNELMPLTVGNVNLDEKTVYVGSAVESGSMVVGSPKSDAGIRFTVINTSDDKNIVDDLRKHISGKADEDLLFTNQTGKMLSRKVIFNYWGSFARDMDLLMGAEHDEHGHIYDPKDLKADGTPLYPDPSDPSKPRNGHKIAEDLVPYCLRHTFGTDMQRAGVPINLTRYMMGHTDISTTANIYIDSGKDDAISAIGYLNSVGNGVGNN